MSDINTPKDVLELAKAKGAVMADLRFIDLPGVWQHTSVPIHRLEESSFEDGFGFDGSSIRGYQPINASTESGQDDHESPLIPRKLPPLPMNVQCNGTKSKTISNSRSDTKKAHLYF